jgi:hypothetical protein
MASNLTTVNGTAKYCDGEGYSELTFTCLGRDCTYLQNNYTCTQPNGESWSCHNNRTCSGSSSIVSNFSFAQPNVTVTGTQQVSINGTEYTLTQDASGNVSLANGTSSAKQSAAFSQARTISWPLLVFLLLLAALATPVSGQESGAVPCIGSALTYFQIAQSAVTGQVNEFQQQVCGQLVGHAATAPAGPAIEAATVRACQRLVLQLGLTVDAEVIIGGAVTGTEEIVAPVVAIEIAIDGVFLCQQIATCVWDAFVDHGAETLCPSNGHEPANSQPSQPANSQPSQPAANPPAPAPGSAPGLDIPDVSGDACASCQLSVYAQGIIGLANQCNVAVPLGVSHDVSVLLCDSSYNGRYASFCSSLCANQCTTYNIKDWIQSAGSSYMSDATLATCSSDCPGFKGDGACQQLDECPCAQGAKTCEQC